MQNQGHNPSEYDFTGPQLFPADEGIDIKRYFSLLISNWYWFAIGLFIAFSVAYSINRWSEPIYRASSSLLIKDEQIGGGAGIEPIFPGTEAFKIRQNLSDEIGILKSYSLNRRVMDSLPDFHMVYVGVGRKGIAESRQYTNCPFRIIYDNATEPDPFPPINVRIESDSTYSMPADGNGSEPEVFRFGTMHNINGFHFRIELRDPVNFRYNSDCSNRYYFYYVGSETLTNEYRGKLRINPIDEDASMVTLSVEGFVPEQEIDYLNELMDAYLNWGLDYKNETARLTLQFIGDQLGSISSSLSDAEDSLEDFRISSRMRNVSEEGARIQSSLHNLGQERASILFQKNYLLYLKDYISSREVTKEVIAPSMVGISDPVLERVITELSNLQARKRDLEMTLDPGMPAVALVDREIGGKIRALGENISSNIERTEIGLRDIDTRISEVEKSIVELPATERRLMGIERDFELNNTVYNYLLEKKAETEIALASNVPDNRIIDRAGLYSIGNIKPQEKRNYLMALLFGLLIPTLAIVIIDLLNNKVIDRKDIERLTSVPILGFISHNDYKTEVPVITKPSSTLAESFRSVRTALKFYNLERGTPVVSVSSTISSEGKTFVSVNLASITAMLGKRVLLIGLDLRKPKIHNILGADNSRGMSTFLSGADEFDDIIQDTSLENLYFAAAGPVPPNPAELIESELMGKFIDEARKRFDYIIIDHTPIAIVKDAILLASYVDISIFVVRQRYTSRNTLSLIEDFYKAKKLKNMAIVINDISLTGYYGYGLRYGYAMRYGGYSYGYSFYGDYSYIKYGYDRDNGGYYTDED